MVHFAKRTYNGTTKYYFRVAVHVPPGISMDWANGSWSSGTSGKGYFKISTTGSQLEGPPELSYHDYEQQPYELDFPFPEPGDLIEREFTVNIIPPGYGGHPPHITTVRYVAAESEDPGQLENS